MTQAKLFDICRANHGGNEASEAAHEDNIPNAEAQRRTILALIQAAGAQGLTCDEIEVSTGLPHQSASARCSELKKAGKVRERGWRQTRRGSKAGVLVGVSGAVKQWWHND